MEVSIPCAQTPLLFSSSKTPQTLTFYQLLTRRRLNIRASSSSANPSGSGSNAFSWLRLGSQKFWFKFGESVKKETGFDLDEANVRVGELVGRVNQGLRKGEGEFNRLRTELLPEFVSWNRWDRWKDLKNWELKRIAALILYIFVAIISCQKLYAVVRAPQQDQERKQLTEAYMEALIPEPSPNNIRKFKKGLWRKTTPKGLKLKKFIEGPNGMLIHDSFYVGENAWDDDPESSKENVKQIIDNDARLNAEEKEELRKELGISGEVPDSMGTWRDRLQAWKEILRKEKLSEQLDSINAKYVVEFDMKEVENSLRKDVVEKVTETQGTRALWISKRWWRYRPKLPYTYFLQKIESSEVAAVVFTEDLKRLYVTMKEGFPLEYIVDIPLDPHLFEIISSSGVEVDLLQKRQIHYFMKVVIALVPGLLILWLIRESAMLLHITSKRFLYKKYNQLFDMAYAENFILPVGDVGETKSMYKEVVLGGDVWDLLDELMIYMGNPMQYYEKGVQFVRGVLLSGPPGTGKTLFARTLAKESGLPFVFASGAEFTDSEKSGAARINEMFSIARRNAPAFVFVDEIDAIAGRHARKDPRRRATFEALIAQLDGEKEKTGVDRFSLRQAVIFICATNRPDELDLEFVRLGRIDRRLYIGLPDAKQRVQIFGVHSAGKLLAEDVNFEQLVFRTVGFSGADIRNLVNEAAIMSVRKGHSKISQQDIIDVLDKQLLEGMGVLLTEEEQQKCEASVSFEKKRLLAVHEAGHIVLAHLFPRFDWHAFSQLLPGGKETAISVFYPREDMVDQGYTTFGYMKMQMVVAHGGRCAERVVFGDDITDGGRDDLEKITKIAREMVISPQNARLGLTQLTKRVGLLDRPDSPDGELIKYRWDDPHVIPSNMTLEVSELFSRELTRYIEETEELAINALKDNRHILDMIAKELLEKQNHTFQPKTHLQQLSISNTKFPVPSMTPAQEGLQWRKSLPSKASDGIKMRNATKEALVAARRPDSGGVEGPVISLLANHFLVKFDPSLKVYHYNVEISPNPSKEVARMIKQKLVESNSGLLCGAHPAYDGRKNFYSPVEFQNGKLEFFVSLPIPTANTGSPFGEWNGFQQKQNQLKVFRINIRAVSNFDGKDLSSYLSNESDDWIPLPQDYLHALDVVLRESPMEKCICVGRSFYSSSTGGTKEIGGGAIGWRGFFQSLRPTQQGLALNVDSSITVFHESIGVIPYLQKRIDFLRDLTQRKTRSLSDDERKEVEKALRNIRVFVCHRETVQRYRVYGLTEEATENLYFADRDGKNLKLIGYFKDHYNYNIQFRNLPCLQISRSKPCYLPMELCMICEGQKFLGKLSDDQTARILKMGCQRPKERKAMIDGIVRGPAGPTSGNQAEEFKLHVSKEMSRLNGRILQPPKLKLGDGGHVRDITPSRRDRQWNLLNSHVFQGTRIERWALLSFGGTQEQKSNLPKFINQLSQRCEQLGIFLSKSTVVSPQFEPTQVLNNVTLLESKLKKIHRAASNNLQLLICIMEKKHKGYADLKRIAETSVGVVSQCCLYPNLGKLSSQFLANLALKINAKVGGSTVALYNSLPSQIPRLFRLDEPVIFIGADVTHPHPLDDSSPSVAGVVGSMNWPAANKYVSRMRSQTHRQEIIQDLAAMVEELLDDFYQEVNKLPKRIIFFRDGVSETQFYKVLKEELQAVKEACARFPGYKPPITFAVVQKRHHTWLFPFEINPSSNQNQHFDENIPPGTVVDTVITHPREFDFYLCSHWGVKGTSRPTHYHVLWDENRFTSDELQKLVYNLCYTFARCTKPVSLVPPAYYAHLAAYRGRLYLERSESVAFTRSSNIISRVTPPKTTPLPKLSENVKKLMFYC